MMQPPLQLKDLVNGTLETNKKILFVRNARIDTVEHSESRDIRRVADTVVSSTVVNSRVWVFPPPPPPPPRRPPPPPPRRWDPHPNHSLLKNLKVSL